MRQWFAILALALGVAGISTTVQAGEKGAKDNTPPPGFEALFNGKDLSGWQGLAMAPDTADPKVKKARALPVWLTKHPADEIAKRQKDANDKILPHWSVKDGVLEYDGKGNSLQSVKLYGNFELYLDWKIMKDGDSGIYLRGNPQVQVWSLADRNNPKKVGSGGLYNNQKHPSNPLVNADNPVGEWNTFHIVMKGDKATIKLNGKLVVDNTPLENYWHRGQPLPDRGPIELQHHGNTLWFKNIYVKELPD